MQDFWGFVRRKKSASEDRTHAPNRKKCIWYVSKYVLAQGPDDPPSRAQGIMREIQKQNYVAVVVSSDAMGKFNVPRASSKYEISHVDQVIHCRVRTLQYESSRSLRRVLSWIHFEWRLLRAPTKLLPSPDCVVVSSLSLLTIFNGLWLRRRHNCRLVFEVRDIWPLALTAIGQIGERNPLIRLLGRIERTAYEKADAVVGTMPNISEHVAAIARQPTSTYCIPQGVDLARLVGQNQLVADDVDDVKWPSSSKFKVGYAGSVGSANSLDVLMECAELMQHDERIEFALLGEGELLKTYRELYGELDNLTFYGAAPRRDVHAFLKSCDLLYFSVKSSALYDYGISPNKVIDYMAASRPIVASYSGYPSMIDESGCGEFVKSEDAVALVAAVEKYAAMDYGERSEIGKRGYDWLVANRGFNKLASEYVKIMDPRVP